MADHPKTEEQRVDEALMESFPASDTPYFVGGVRNQPERKTEDEIAREKLGGVKGSKELPPAPLTRQEKEQMPENNEPGHVA